MCTFLLARAPKSPSNMAGAAAKAARPRPLAVLLAPSSSDESYLPTVSTSESSPPWAGAKVRLVLASWPWVDKAAEAQTVAELLASMLIMPGAATVWRAQYVMGLFLAPRGSLPPPPGWSWRGLLRRTP